MFYFFEQLFKLLDEFYLYLVDILKPQRGSVLWCSYRNCIMTYGCNLNGQHSKFTSLICS